MRKTVVRLGLVASLVSLLWLTTGCGGSGGSNNTQPPPPAAPTVAVLPTSASVLVGQTQTFSLTVTGSPTVTCSVNGPGSCSVSGTASVSYTGAAPPSGGDWKATLTLTAANAGGQATASVAIALGQITGVTLTPASAVITTAQTQKFTAAVQYNGTCDDSVNWQVSPAGTGTIASDGTFTPSQAVKGFITVTVTVASGMDPTKSSTATVTVGFNWVAYYAPQELNDSATTMALSSDETELVVSDARDIPDLAANPADQYYTNQTAGLLLFSTQTGELLDSSWTDSPTPSRVTSMATDPSTGTIYAGGYEYNDASREAVVWKIIPSNPLQVSKLGGFQLGGVRTEVRVLQLYGGNIYLAVNGDDTTSFGGCVVKMDLAGNKNSEWSLDSPSSGQRSPLTGMFVSSQWIFFAGVMLGDNGKPQYMYEGHMDFTGTVQPPFWVSFKSPTGYPVQYGMSIFQNAAGEVLTAGTIAASDTQQYFLVSGSDAQLNFNLVGEWNGGNSGAVTVSIKTGAAFNPQGGLAIVGSCSQAGSTDPTQTVGCMISYPGQQTGDPLASIFSQVFGQGYMPGGSSSALTSVVFDSQGTAYLAGSGTDGRSGCGATPCSTVVVGKFVPPPAGS